MKRRAIAFFIAAGLAARGALGADAASTKEITDEQVVASMQKAIDYLLSQKKNDTWESEFHWNRDHPRFKGGETSLVLYALLHAGESLQDNPDYKAKLHWRSKELAPTIEWLSNQRPRGTYSVALQASALTLIPKRADQKPGAGPQGALDAGKAFLIEAMGREGGYSYTSHLYQLPNNQQATPIGDLWDRYCQALKKRDTAQQKVLKDEIDLYMKSMADQAGGQEWAAQSLRAELRARKQAAATPADAAMYEAELKEFENYCRNMPAPPPAKDKTIDLRQAKKQYEDLLAARKTGQLLNPRTQKMEPIAKEDLEKKIASHKNRIDSLENEIKTGFVPFGDLSNGQYGALGAWAISDYGMELPSLYWTRTDRFWRQLQNEDGAWPYHVQKGDKESTPSMGAAGIATLFVCQEFTDNELRLVPKPDKDLDEGLAWLAKTYDPTLSKYYMYSVERVGLSSGLKFFGTTDWYKQGAAAIVAKQRKDGSWAGEFSGTVDTSYALLFLSRGRNPVVFNKLQHNGPWNARPRDSAYVTRWMSKHLEKPINWQVVNLEVSPEEWLDAPILLITGSVDPKFTKADIEKLRAYINAGGMIFSTADGATAGFTTAMKKYAAELVNNKYEMRVLPPSHDLFSKELGVDLPNPPGLIGMSNGLREIWIHSPQDIGADWQMRRFSKKASFELGAALYFYASGMASLRSKLQPLTIAAHNGAPSRTSELARVDYSGNADPEPGAWPRLAKFAAANYQTAVKLSTVKFADLDAKKYPVAHLIGTNRVTFSDEDAKNLKNYLEAGGLLFAEAGGGNADFATSCRELFAKVYPDAALSTLAPDHPIFSDSIPGTAKLTEIEFRKFGGIKLQRRVTAPLLESITVGGRARVIFSQWDITSGLLGTNTWGIVGYNPAACQAIARNILLYALSPKTSDPAPAKATTPPAP
jgi:hypothetical protein